MAIARAHKPKPLPPPVQKAIDAYAVHDWERDQGYNPKSMKDAERKWRRARADLVRWLTLNVNP